MYQEFMEIGTEEETKRDTPARRRKPGSQRIIDLHLFIKGIKNRVL